MATRVDGFEISVAEILGQPGTFRDIALDRPMPGVETTLAHLDTSPLHAVLRAESVVEGILVTGGVTGHVVLECARRLTEIPADISFEVCELYVAPGHEEAADEDAYRVQGLEIDLEPMLRDAVMLDLPLNPLCRKDCKGLCARCGQDLNDAACSCQEVDNDPRWEALDALRERLDN